MTNLKTHPLGATPDASAETLAQWDQDHYWHSFTQMQEYAPLVIAEAEGCHLIDCQGRRYLDGASSMWCNVHGHNHPAINQAIRDQLDRAAHVTSLGMGCDTTVRLARRLAELAPGDLDRVLFSSDGSSSIEVALKAAFQYWRQCDHPRPAKTKFLAFGQAYHGDTIGAASLGGIGKFHALFTPLLFDAVRVPAPDAYRLPDGVSSEDACRYYLELTEQAIIRHAEELAAVVIEPLVQCAAGMVMHPPGFLRGLRQLCTQHDVLLILDEVAVGFGKTGKLFACEQEEVTPDFLCLGKGLTGGYLPMAATVTSTRVYDAFLGDAASGRALYHGHTFCGNPLCAAAALASMELFEQEQTLKNLAPKVQLLGERFCRLARHPWVDNARQTGIIAAADYVGDRPFGREVARYALDNGVWVRPQPSMLYVMPPLAMSLDDLGRMMDVLERGIERASGVQVP